jgi:AICAR transformylase/IMP cyclohydrolase PurH
MIFEAFIEFIEMGGQVMIHAMAKNYITLLLSQILRDKKVIDAPNWRHMQMIFTGVCYFWH